MRHRLRPTQWLRALRPARALAFGAVTLAALCGSTAAHADNMDPSTERFIKQPGALKGTGQTCQAVAKNPSLLTKPPFPSNAVQNAASYACQPDNVSFDNLVSEYAFAIAPNAFHPARTTGFGGFNFTFEASYTKINNNTVDSSGVAYWHTGTQGPVNPNNGYFSTRNNSPDSLLQLYSLKARKGFPFGFEITGDVGYMPNSTLWVAGADVRWALFEGFRTGALGFIPDLSVGSGVRTLTGTSEFDLTTVGLDVQVSKGLALSDSAVLTPYLGYQHLWVFGDSQLVSLTPNINPLTSCGFNGISANGAPICRNGMYGALAFNNDAVFNSVRNHRDRGIVGVNYRFEVLYLAAQFLIDLVDPNSEDGALAGGRQWTLSLEAGVYF